MNMITIQWEIPEEMKPYIDSTNKLRQNAILLYPYILVILRYIKRFTEWTFRKNYLLYLQENMAKFVKVILFLLLTVTLHGVASNVFTEKPVEQSELAITYSMKQHEQISAPDFPYAPVAELNNLQSHQISVTRIQRVQLGEYFTTLRNLLQCCADRENSLSQHRGRIYNTTTSYYCQPSSEYYVFTLRHIII